MNARFLFWFAWRDLTDRVVLRTTIVVWATVAFACAFTLSGFSFNAGVERVRYQRLREDPLALCLWVGDTLTPDRIGPETVAELEKGILSRLANPSHLRGVHPFHQVPLLMRLPEGKGAVQVVGRTLTLGEKGDPLLDSRPLRPGGTGFHSPKDEGILITPALFRELNLPTDSAPKTLDVSLLGNRNETVPILGILEKDLPTPHSFLILSAYAHALRSRDIDPEISRVYTGPVGTDWGTREADLPPKVRELLEFFEVKFLRSFALANNKKGWLLQSGLALGQREKKSLSEWSEIVRRIADQMGKEGLAEAKEFPQLDLRGETPPSPPERLRFDLAGVYMDELRSLEPAASAIEAVKAGDGPLTVDRSVIEKVTSIGAQAELVSQALAVVAGAFITVALWNILVILSMRAESQVAEMGMLKAMGMSHGALQALNLLEGAMIWAVGASIGMVLGLAATRLLASWFYRDNPREAALGFHVDPQLLIGVAIGAGLACLGCSWWANRQARRAAPAESLRTAG